MLLQILNLIPLLATPSDKIWVEILVAILGGCGIGTFITSWAIIQTGKKIWRSIATEFILTKDFCDAVNSCRKQAEWDFTEKIKNLIKEHDKEEWPHGKWRHEHYNNDIARLELRIVQLEQKSKRGE